MLLYIVGRPGHRAQVSSPQLRTGARIWEPEEEEEEAPHPSGLEPRAVLADHRKAGTEQDRECVSVPGCCDTCGTHGKMAFPKQQTTQREPSRRRLREPPHHPNSNAPTPGFPVTLETHKRKAGLLSS